MRKGLSSSMIRFHLTPIIYWCVFWCVCVCHARSIHDCSRWTRDSLVVCFVLFVCACVRPPPPLPRPHTQCLQRVRWTISAVLCYFTAYVNQLQEAYMTLFTVDSCKAIDLSFNNGDAVHPDKTICAGSVNNVWPCLVSRMLLLGQHT